MPDRPLPRRPVIAIGVVAALLVCAALSAWVLRGATDTSGQSAAHAEQARQRFADTLAPSEDVSSTMVVPAASNWWKVVTGFAAPLGLTATPLPDGARWLAYSTAHTKSGLAEEITSYPALYVGFDTDDDALAYAPPQECACKARARANVATIIGVTADFDVEPLPELTHVDPEDLAASSGAWRINLTALISDLTEHSPYRDQQLAMFAALGVPAAAEQGPATSDVIWTATAKRPEGPWTGKVEGLVAADIDLTKVGAAVAATTKDHCSGDVCQVVDEGIFAVIDTLFVEDADFEFGNSELGDPETVDAPLGDNLVRGALELSRFEGAFTALDHIHTSAISAARFTLDKKHTLTLNLTLD